VGEVELGPDCSDVIADAALSYYISDEQRFRGL